MLRRRELSFEVKIIIAVCTLGILRLFHPLYYFIIGMLEPKYILFNGILFFVLTIALITSLFVRNSNRVSIPMSVILVMLLSVNWIMSGGIEGVSEMNLILILVTMAMINKGRIMVLFVALVFISIITLVLLWEFNFELIQPLFVAISTNVDKYQMTIVMSAIGVGYLAYRYEYERRQQLKTGSELQQRVKELEIENRKLELKEMELKRWNNVLYDRIKVRSKELKRSNESIQSFLSVNTEGIRPKIMSTIGCIDEIQLADKYVDLLKESGAKLNKAQQDITPKG